MSPRPLQWDLPLERLLDPRHATERKRPGFVRIARPDQLWFMDATRVRVGEWWATLHVVLDCCTREVVGWTLEAQSRPVDAITCVELAIARRDADATRLTIGTPHRSPFTARIFRRHLRSRGISRPRRQRNDLMPRAFADSWFDHFHSRCAHRSDWQRFDEARAAIAAYVDTYLHRQQVGLAYCTPADVAAMWRGASA